MLIEMFNVCKKYSIDEIDTRALSDITFSMNSGEYVAIKGPSGCGKSTLLSIVGLLDVPTSGIYRFNNSDTAAMTSHAKAHVRNREIGFIFQNFNLIADLTVEENVELPLTYRGMAESERRSRVAETLERVGLVKRAKHLPSHLSGGQQQRVAVARALIGRPLLLLADEPTGNLDSVNAGSVMDLLDQINRDGTGIVMVTHDSRFADKAGRQLDLFDGSVVSDTSRLLAI